MRKPGHSSSTCPRCEVGRRGAPAPAAGPLAGLPRGGRGRPSPEGGPRSRGTAPPSRLFFAAAMAAYLAAAPADPVAWKLQNPSAAPVKAGARFHVKWLAEVQEGWHLYSLKPMAEGPIPTRIWIAEGQPFSLAGVVQSPDPQVMQDPSFGMEVELYEGEGG